MNELDSKEEKIDGNKIKEVLNFLGDSIKQKQIDLYKSLINDDIYDVNDCENFYFSLIYPFENFVSGLISTELSNNEDVIFLMKNSQFINSHFNKLFQKFEGYVSCSDKSRIIVRRLIKFYKTGKKIEWDYNQEFTFHLPKTIFKTHEQIVNFYKALKDLYYGSGEKYFVEMLEMHKQITNEK